MVFSTVITGRLQDWTFKSTRRDFDRRKSLHSSTSSDVEKNDKSEEPDVVSKGRMDPNDLLDFPLEEARLKLQPVYSVVFWMATIAYGWLVEKRVNLVAPLIVQFIGAYDQTVLLV